MRSLLLLMLGAASAFSQPFTLGVKGGVPLTDFVDTVETGRFTFNPNTKRYIVGATAELRLPFGLGVELDALYRRLDYSGSGNIVGVTTTVLNNRTTSNAWEFPLLAKYRFPSRIVRPFVDAGVAFDTLQGLSQTVRTTVAATGITTSNTTSTPVELHKKTTVGYVVGAGLEIKALLIRISPEIRYTRWGAKHFLDPNGLIDSNQNQAEFLLGITF